MRLSTFKQCVLVLFVVGVLYVPGVTHAQGFNNFNLLLETARADVIDLAHSIGYFPFEDQTSNAFNDGYLENDTGRSEVDNYITAAELDDTRDNILDTVRRYNLNLNVLDLDDTDTYEHPDEIELDELSADSLSAENASLGSTSAAELAVTGTTTVGENTLFIDTNTNRVGIATTTPEYTLDVSGTLRAGSIVGTGSTIGGDQTIDGNLSVTENTTLGDTASDDTLTLNSRLNSDLVPNLTDTYTFGTEALRFSEAYLSSSALIDTLNLSGGSITDSSGSIDFGDENLTTSGSMEANMLTINGTGQFTDTLDLNSGLDVTGGNLYMQGNSSNINLGNNWLSGDGSDEGIFIDSSGHVGVNVPGGDGIYDLSIGDTNSGINSPGNGRLDFAVNGFVPFELDASDSDQMFIFDIDRSLRGNPCDSNNEVLETEADGRLRCGTENSDERLKNITARDVQYGLDEISNMEFIQYTWKEELSGYTNDPDITYQGFSAQNVMEAAPNLVIEGHEGYYGLDKWGMIATAWNGIQELDAKVSTSTSGPNSLNAEDFEEPEKDSFVGRLFSGLRGWFADSANGITSLFAGRVTTQQLCVDEDTCLDKDELSTLIEDYQSIKNENEAGEERELESQSVASQIQTNETPSAGVAVEGDSQTTSKTIDQRDSNIDGEIVAEPTDKENADMDDLDTNIDTSTAVDLEVNSATTTAAVQINDQEISDETLNAAVGAANGSSSTREQNTHHEERERTSAGEATSTPVAEE